MSADRRDERDPALVEAFAELSQDRPELPGWQAAVWSEIDRQEERRGERWWRGWRVWAVLVPAIAAVVMAVFAQQKMEESAKKDRELRLLAAAIDDKNDEIQRQVAEVEERYKALLEAKTDDEKAEALRELEEAQAELAKKQATLKKLQERKRGGGGKSWSEKSDKSLKSNNCPPDDPLCGLGGGSKKKDDKSLGKNACPPDDPLCGL